MAIATFTKTGTKAATPAKLDKSIFEIEVKDHSLLSQAYNTYLAEKRRASANTKTRHFVSGSGKKPWKQKGTGRARVGSIRSPLWRGGAVIFGPTGNENHKLKLSTTSKHTATRQALSLAQTAGKVIIIEDFVVNDGKTKSAAELLKKIGASRRTLVVVAEKDEKTMNATNNLENTQLVGAKYLSVFTVLNADTIIIAQPALDVISEWLGGTK